MSSNNNFTFCPKCGGKSIHFNIKYWKCDDCQFVLYHNTTSASGLIISDNDNNIYSKLEQKILKKEC